MPAKTLFSIKTLLTSFFVLTALCVSLRAAAPRPNIVYFMVDDMGFADAGFNGGKDILTPHIDALAKQGAVLGAFYGQPVCSPTRAAFLSGRYPTHTSAYNIYGPNVKWGFPLKERLLSQALQEAGYTTAICGKWHLGDFTPAYTPTNRGFDHQYGCWGGSLNYDTHIKMGKLDWHRDDQPSQDAGYTTHLLAQDAAQVIADQPADKPLFLYVAFNAVHSPYQVPDSYRKPYANLSKNRQTMAALLSSVDEAIGQVVAALKKKGLLDRTLILFSSDNGGVAPGSYTENTPLRSGKGTIYEGGVRLCAFAIWPGKIPAGLRIHEPMHIVDWYPTLLTLAGLPLTQKLPLDGRDIWPVLTQGAKSPHDAILLMGRAPHVAALRMGDWKLLINPSDLDSEEEGGKKQGNNWRDKPKAEHVELYHLADDISEQKNLAASHPEKVQELRARFDAFMKDAVPPAEHADQSLPDNPDEGVAKKKSGKKAK